MKIITDSSGSNSRGDEEIISLPSAGESTTSEPQISVVPPLSSEPASVVSDSEKTVISQRPIAAPEEFYRSMPLAELASLLEGKQLDHFQVEQMIGGGGMGAVFRGRDLRLDRIVAIKVIPASKRDADTLRRFRLEAQSAARLDHPNIARVYYVGEAERWNYIVFEFIDGVNIRDLVDMEGPLSVDDAVFYTRQVAEALQHAADRNVVHRDIKPSNLLVTAAGAAKVVDMGLARDTSLDKSSADATASGVTLGTFDYISPEQARNPRDADVRSDLYSLGCTLFFMLTGNPPFPEGTALQKLLNHGSQPPPDPRAWREDLSDELYEILMKLMAKRPSDRYQKPVDLINDLLLLAEAENLPRSRSPGTVLMAPSVAQRSLLESNLPWMVAAALLVGTTLWMQSVQSLSSTFTIPMASFAAPNDLGGPGSNAPPKPLLPNEQSPLVPFSETETADAANRNVRANAEERESFDPSGLRSSRESSAERSSNLTNNSSLPVGSAPPVATNSLPTNSGLPNASSLVSGIPDASSPGSISPMTLPVPPNSTANGNLIQPGPKSDSALVTQSVSNPSETTATPNRSTQPTVRPGNENFANQSNDSIANVSGGNATESDLTGAGTGAARSISTLVVSNRLPTGVERQAWSSSLADALRRAEIETEIRTIEIVGNISVDSSVRIARPDLTIRSGTGLGADAEQRGRATIEFAPSLLMRLQPGESLFEIASQSLQCLDLNFDVASSSDILARDVSLFGVGPGGKLDLDGCRITIKGSPLTHNAAVVTIADGKRRGTSQLLSDRFDERPKSDVLEPSSITLKNSIVRGDGSLIKVLTSQRIEIELKQMLIALVGYTVDIAGVESDERMPPVMRMYCQRSSFATAEGFARILYRQDSPPSLALNRNSQNCVYWSSAGKAHFQVEGVQRAEDLDALMHLQGGENAYDANIELLCKCLTREEAEVDIQFSSVEAAWFQEYGNEWSVSWLNVLPQLDLFHQSEIKDFNLRSGMFMPGFEPGSIAPTLVD